MKLAMVIVRAFGGQPLKRVAVGYSNGAVHIAAPASLEAVKRGWTSPVGFPPCDVFCYETDAYERIEGIWDASGEISPQVWGQLVPFNPESAVSRETV